MAEHNSFSSEKYTIPSQLTADVFGKVRVYVKRESLNVDFTTLMEPQGRAAEGWQTGVALDASASMMGWYGLQLLGKVPPDALAEYEQKQWIHNSTREGKQVTVFKKEARQDAIERGFLKYSENIVSPCAQQFISYLAGNLDADGGTTAIYWACGDGSAIEILGDFTETQCRALRLEGPRKTGFGQRTILLPAIQYFAERFASATRGMYIFITDGKIDDLAEVKVFTKKIAQSVAAGRSNQIKFVLIGVGNQVDEGQMIELDDYDTGTNIDIWDHKIAHEMRALIEIFAEVVNENHIVAPKARIFDSDGNIARVYADGLPARTSVSLPRHAKWFELEVSGTRIRQDVLC